MDSKARRKYIIALCDSRGCDKETAKRHYELFMDGEWNPHPTENFSRWWMSLSELVRYTIAPVTAYNCQCYRDQYLEAKSMGVIDL